MPDMYTVDRTDLEAVADAIRAKNETSEALVFPSGFVTAIENIRGGADLNFDVVGGTERPGSPKENTIWVNTGTDMTEWTIGREAPSSAAEGAVFIELDSATGAGFDAINNEENLVYLKIKNAYQRTGGAWEEKDVSIFQGGSWIELSTEFFLFKEGSGAQNGYTVKQYLDATSHGNVTNARILWSNSAGSGGSFAITPQIDLTGYSTLYVELQCTGRYGNDSRWYNTIGVGSVLPSGTVSAGSFTSSVTQYSTERAVVAVPVDTVNKAMYVKFLGNATTGYVYNIWLE